MLSQRNQRATYWVQIRPGGPVGHWRAWPAWWADVERLHGEGLNNCQIGRRLGRGESSVRCAVRAMRLPANTRAGGNRPRVV